MFCTGLMYAQPTPSEVEVPGSKGTLPKVQEIAPARDGEVTILNLSHVGFSPLIINGYVDIEANLSFPMVSEVGCEYYTLQYRAPGDAEWQDYKNGNEGAYHVEERVVGLSPDIYSITEYRLVLHGGELDGKVSNTVTAYPISMASRYTGWSESPTIEHCMVGKPVGDELSFTAETYKGGNITGYSTAENPDVFTYQWYRRNPNNWDMEKIEGATDSIYTPTVQDVGYQLVIEVGGDKKVLDYHLFHPLNGVVTIPVQASVAYIGKDGFILSTDYVIPEPQKSFVNTIPWSDEQPDFDPSCISEVKPGQYAFRLSEQEYAYGIYELNNPAYFLTFIYKGMGGEGEDWYREVQIMSDRYKAALNVKPQFDDASVVTTVDVIGKNIDGEWGVVASQAVDATTGYATFDYNWDDNPDNRLFYGDYYVKAHATATTSDTYYPSATTMESATPVTLSFENSWEPLSITIDMKDKATAIDRISANTAAAQYFMIDGRCGKSRGLNIMRMSDGTVKKVIVK